MYRFTNVSMSSEHMKTQAFGGAEGIFASVKPAFKSEVVGYSDFFTCPAESMQSLY